MDQIGEGAPVAEEPHPLANLMEQQQPEQTEQEPEAKAEQEGEGDEKKPESKNYSQEEVDRIVRKAKRNAAYLARKEAEAELYRQMATKPVQQDAQPAPKADDAPKRENFESYEDYIEARAEWRAEQKVQAALEQQAQRQQQQTQQTSQAQQVQRFQAQLQEVAKTLPDFQSVMEAADEVPLTQAMRDAILESEVGALLTYHLAKNPAEASRIASLSATGQIKALGAIEASLNRKPEPQVSKAPTPITPISGGSASVRDPSKMSMDEYAAWRKKQGASWARR